MIIMCIMYTCTLCIASTVYGDDILFSDSGELEDECALVKV